MTRPRLPKEVSATIHRQALRLNLTESAMTLRAISVGLASLGAPLPARPVELNEQAADGTRILVPVSADVNLAIRRLAAEENRSTRNMTRQLIYEGLRSLGALPSKATDLCADASHVPA